MIWWLKSFKYASQNNSNGEEMKKQPYIFEMIEKFEKIFQSFFFETNVYKKHKI